MINYFGKEGINLLHKILLKEWKTHKRDLMIENKNTVGVYYYYIPYKIKRIP